MSEDAINNPKQSLLSRLVVIALIAAVIVVTIVAGKKATAKPTQRTYQSTPSVLTPTPSVTQKESAVVEERCFINLNGKRYDVSDFRKEHEGGNIFICGTDMTEQFKDEHKNDFARAEDYEVDEQGNFVNKK